MATTLPAVSRSVIVIVLPLSPMLSSPGSCTPLLLSSENTVDPIDPSDTIPKSIVLSPSSSAAVPLVPPSPGSFVGSVPGIKVITGDVMTPSVMPSPSVSCCIPLSSLSTPSSPPLPSDDTGEEAGGMNSTT